MKKEETKKVKNTWVIFLCVFLGNAAPYVVDHFDAFVEGFKSIF